MGLVYVSNFHISHVSIYIVTPKKSCTTRNRPFAECRCLRLVHSIGNETLCSSIPTEYTKKNTQINGKKHPEIIIQNNAKTIDGGHMFPLATCDGEETVC